MCHASTGYSNKSFVLDCLCIFILILLGLLCFMIIVHCMLNVNVSIFLIFSSGFTFYKMTNLDNRIANADQLLTQVCDTCMYTV